jgi:hypothetical protein
MCNSIKVSKNVDYHWFKNKDIIVLKTSTEFLKERMKFILIKVGRFTAAVGFKKN